MPLVEPPRGSTLTASMVTPARACSAAALAHLARTVCRRAERGVVALGQKDKISAHVRRYLNRLSDLLFVAARILNRHAGRSDVQWRHERNKPSR